MFSSSCMTRKYNRDLAMYGREESLLVVCVPLHVLCISVLYVCKMINRYIQTYTISAPDSMLSVTLAPLIKDKVGKVGSVDNYRQIALARVLSKALERIFN